MVFRAAKGVLFIEVYSFQGVLIRGVPQSGFNLAYVLEGAKLIIVETWRGYIWQGRRGIVDDVICLGGEHFPPPCTPLA